MSLPPCRLKLTKHVNTYIKEILGVEFMPRNNRIVFEGAIYHITHRGNNKEYILKYSRHKSFLLKQIREYNKKFDFQLLAYTIMDNHYHILIKTNKDPINKIMFYINNVVGKYLNRELHRTGHVFENRYSCSLVDTDAYLIWLLRYIHRNPVRAHICSNVDDYKWSSHYYYKNGINIFVNTDFALKIISPDKRIATSQYLELVNINENQADSKSDYETIKNLFKLQEKPLFYNQEETTNTNIKPLNEILYSLPFDSQLKELIKSGSKKRCLTQLKIEFIKAALLNKHTLKEIADFMKISQPGISNFLTYHNIDINQI